MEVVFICLAVAVAAAFIVTGILRAQLKSVRWQKTAGSYVVKDSFRLTGSREQFLYDNVTKIPRSNNSGKKR